MLAKRLALVTPLVLFTAFSGQASAHPAHSMTQHSTPAFTSTDTQDPEAGPEAGVPSQAVHRYTGGPKTND